MSPDEAAHFGVRQGELMKLRVGATRGATSSAVHVRIEPHSRLDVHMDTDEANACGLRYAKEIGLHK